MKNRLISVFALCFAFLIFISTSINKVSSEENNVIKVSDNLRAALSNLAPSDTLLLWLDLYLSKNPDGIDVVTNHTLTTTPKRVNGAFQLRLTEHPRTHSYIDQVKLFAVLQDKTMIELPLISAIHSEYGNVLPQLLSSDNWKTDLLGANWNNGTSQSIDLKLQALPPNTKVIGFLFIIEGNNPFYKV